MTHTVGFTRLYDILEITSVEEFSMGVGWDGASFDRTHLGSTNKFIFIQKSTKTTPFESNNY